MRRAALALAAAALAAVPVLGQVGGPVPQTQNPDAPRSGSSGFPGVGLSIRLGGKKKAPEPALTGPPLEMRDRAIPDFVPGQVLFFITGDEAAAKRIARTGRVRFLRIESLPEMGVAMVVAGLQAGDTVPAAVERLGRLPGRHRGSGGVAAAVR